MAEDTSPSELQSKMVEDHKHKGSGMRFRYALREAIIGMAVFNLNNLPTTVLIRHYAFSIITTNQNERVLIFYDHLLAFVLYHNQMITLPVKLLPLFQEKNSTVQLAWVLGGGGVVPVSPEVCYKLGMEEAYGTVGFEAIFF